MNQERRDRLQKIIDKSLYYNGELLHKAVLKITHNLTELEDIDEIFRLCIKTNLFISAREYILLKDYIHNNKELIDSEINIHLDLLTENVIKPALDEKYWNNIDDPCDIVLMFFAINEKEKCINYLWNNFKAKKILYSLIQLCYYDKDLSGLYEEVIFFFLDGLKQCNDDYINSQCITVIDLNDNDLQHLLENGFANLLKLTKYYYENNMFYALLELINRIKPFRDIFCEYCKEIYRYLGISKEVFLEKLLKNGLASALETYIIMKFPESFPELSDMMNIINLNTSSSVYCLIYMTLEYLESQGDFDNKSKKILIYINNGLKNGSLKYNSYQHYSDKGIDRGKLFRLTVKIFQHLCRNKKDVYLFINLIACYNSFYNGDVSFDFGKLNEELVKTADWVDEYEYICFNYDRYKAIYVIMNSYLHFFVDIPDLVKRYQKNFQNYWFYGFMTNMGYVKPFQAKLNRNYYNNKFVLLYDKSAYKNLEESVNVRYKISGVSGRTINIEQIQNMQLEYTKKNCYTLARLLYNESISDAYNLLFEMKKDNLFSKDRYTYDSKKEFKELVCCFKNLVKNHAQEYKHELNYIYMNSFLKTLIEPKDVVDILDEENVFLGNIMMKNNSIFSDRYYITPNFFNPYKTKYKILKESIDRELAEFIDDQITFFMENEGKCQGIQSVRVDFHLPLDQDTLFINNMHFHCCNRTITNMYDLLLIYYSGIYKTKREGISYQCIKKYFNVYKRKYYEQDMDLNEETNKLFDLYLDILLKELKRFNRYNCYTDWFSSPGKYNMNPFVMLQVELFEKINGFTPDLIEYILNNKIFKNITIEFFDVPYDMRKKIYSMTIIKYLMNSFEEFDNYVKSENKKINI